MSPLQAIIGAGGIVFGTNPSSPASELQRHLIDTSARYIITQPQAVDVVEQVASLCDISENSIFVLDQPGVKGPPSLQTFTTLLDHVETTTGVFNGHHGWTPSQTAAYCSTSGTTGLPKAARISHSYMVAQAHMIEQGLRSRSYQVRVSSALLLTMLTVLTADTIGLSSSVPCLCCTDCSCAAITSGYCHVLPTSVRRR